MNAAEDKVLPSSATSEPPASSEKPKAKRTRVPRDLARQYGESESRRDKNLTPAATRRARRDAEMRERRHRVMLPDDNFLQRLARAGAIANSDGSAPIAVETVDETMRDEPIRPARAPRQWSAACGKCRWNGTFKTGAALCPRCGTILVKP